MFEAQKSDWKTLIAQEKALIEGERDLIANLANSAALLNWFLEDINWVGFYLLKENQLVLGPFQGLPACIRIPLGKGVCGTAASEMKTQRIADVHQFPGHIACDGATNAEIVIPLIKEQRCLGVLDIDSPSKSRFSEEDKHWLEEFVSVLIDSIA